MLMSKYLARRELARAEELLNALPEAPFYDKRQLRINLLTAQERYPEAAKAAEEKLLDNPQLFNTPIVRNGKQVTLGYHPEVWETWE